MSTLTTETKSLWDLSDVIEFHNAALSHADSTAAISHKESDSHPRASNDAEPDENNGGVSLGSFDKIWQFLGTPVPTKDGPPRIDHQTRSVKPARKLDYTSDGAAYTLSRPKPIQRHPSFTDGTDGEDIWATSSKAADATPLTKTQKKRMRRKERREQEIAQARLNGGRADAISESEAETAGRKTPARKASAHVMKEKNKEQAASQAASKAGSSQNATVASKGTSAPGRAKTPVPERAKTAKVPALPGKDNSTDQAVNAVAAAMAAINTKSPQQQPSTPKQTFRQLVAQSQPVRKTQVQQPQAVGKLHLVPASVGVQPKLASQNDATLGINATPVAMSMHVPTAPASAKKARPQPVIEPKIIRSGEDRHWALLMKLISEFGQDRKHLVAPMNLASHNNDPKGIHVFVDASNICIGFMDMLKSTRGIHPMAHLPQANLSFDGLALLMERRRPVAKRVLAGSYPWLPAFDKAKAIGYEMNMFEKVYKARELTDRQLYFQQQDARRYSKSGKKPAVHPGATIIKSGTSPPVYSVLRNGIGGGSGSGTETSTTPQYAPAKMIEQGVDEILHLKMMESIVDYEVPSTMVLATGDAAQAEYSQGFMAMAERALKKGWTVELISWSKNISRAYVKSNWTGAWDGRFKIIYLDDFAEELLDM
ncbi:hypothetical protein CKM354_001159100 [Cercospora kikuchii]|uniref:NYN domain-containing protein n=1 Tax=Cercospora kikuchii TaxID=84275 RepID=A0A9P3CSJ7_9PEZI|nr:uncharacterized protein CKM354_001159100 [Cercospora kikuchii]GIZ48537.1 hypothetical protein CKM354_001159100 [Cercospora kikuchii]